MHNMATIVNTQLSVIMRALMNTAINSGIGFSPASVYLSLELTPPLQATSGPSLSIQPNDFLASDLNTKGAGRYATMLVGSVDFVIYLRQALDQIYQQNDMLTLSVVNLLDLAHNVLNTFQLSMVLDSNGNGILVEPMRLLNDKRPIRYRKSREWAMAICSFEIKYFENLDTTIPLPLVQ